MCYFYLNASQVLDSWRIPMRERRHGDAALPEIWDTPLCDTSPIQYLHQLELLHILPALAQGVIIPPAVVDEVAAGRALGVDLPDLVPCSRHPGRGTATLAIKRDQWNGYTNHIFLQAMH